MRGRQKLFPILLLTLPLARMASGQLAPAANLSNTPAENSSAPDVAAQGSDVYVVWVEEIAAGGSGIFLSHSHDEGKNFDPPVRLTLETEIAAAPRVAAIGPAVFVVWESRSTPASSAEIRFRRSLDQGEDWRPPLGDPGDNLSLSPDVGSVQPVVAAAGPEVYVVWSENAAPARVLRRRSTDSGASFEDAGRLSDEGRDSANPAIAAVGSHVYVAWEEVMTIGGGTGGDSTRRAVWLGHSADEGLSFNSFEASQTSLEASHPTVTAAGTAVYLAFEHALDSSSPPEVFFAFSFDALHTFSTLEVPGTVLNVSISPLQPSIRPRLAAAGSGFSFVWQEETADGPRALLRSPTLLARGALDFNPAPISDLSPNPGTSRLPAVARTGSSLYIVWEEGDPDAGEILFRRSVPAPNPAQGNLSNDRSRPAGAPDLAAEGSNVYAAWSQFPAAAAGLEVFFRRSADGGRSFGPRINLSEAAGDSARPRLAAAGQAVFAVWEEDAGALGLHDILFRRSLNRGITWEGPPLNLSRFGSGRPERDSLHPTIAAEGPEIYVAWQDETTEDGSPQIFFRRSLDQGESWDPPLDEPPHKVTCESREKIVQNLEPSLVVAGSNVYLAWKAYRGGPLQVHLSLTTDETGPRSCGPTRPIDSAILTDGLPTVTGEPTSPRLSGPRLAAAGPWLYAIWHQIDRVEGDEQHEKIQFRRSRIAGAVAPDETVWEPPIGMPAASLSVDGPARFPAIAASGSEVYVAWESGTPGGNTDVLFRRSVDQGANFETVVNLSGNSGSSRSPSVAAAGSDLYLAWSDDTIQPAFADILFRGSYDEGETFTGCGPNDISVRLVPGQAIAAPGAIVSGTVIVGNEGCGAVTPHLVIPVREGLREVRWCLGEGCLPNEVGEAAEPVALSAGATTVYGFSAVVAPDFLGTLILTAIVSPPVGQIDSDPTDNVAVAQIEIAPQSGLSAFCSSLEGSPLEGNTITFTFILLNGGPFAQADNPGPEFTDTLPPGLLLIGASADSGAVTLGVNTVTWNGAIAAGGRVIVKVTATIAPGTAGATLCNQGVVTYDADGDGINESTIATDVTELPGPADPCCLRVLTLEEIPVLSVPAAAILALLLAGFGLWRAR